jgi:beta-glucosidase-like glycosyl hydrolase
MAKPANLDQTSDGPNGARGEVFTGGTRAACFPAAVCSAATWNPKSAQQIGTALAEETRTKSARVLYVTIKFKPPVLILSQPCTDNVQPSTSSWWPQL